MSTLVSVLVPMRNAEQYIRASLTSILEETGVPLEVVVINDNSTDDSAKVVQGLADDRLHLLDGPGEGIAEALNAGLAVAAGEIIMRCDADDLFTAGRIARQVAWLRDNPSFGAVCGGFSTLDAGGREIADLSTGDDAGDITGELAEGVTRTSLCTFAIRTAVTEKTGRFRPYFVTAEDIDYQLRLCAVTRVMYLPGIVYKYRLHEDSITHQQDAGRRRFFEETARRFQRQRVETGRDELELGRPPAPQCLVGAGPGKASEQIAGMLMGQAWAEHGKGRKWIAIRKGWQALCRQPTDYSHWKSLLALILK